VTINEAWEYVQNNLFSESAYLDLDDGRLALMIIDSYVDDIADEKEYCLSDFDSDFKEDVNL
jgi:hypothetical protein